ncbi:MAG TPA: hypothetical protein VMH33_09190 [Solirubrobacterales bacterium]|nr:hypothetical protein [Solirubrobacterales bacterium]
MGFSRRVDRLANRGLERAYPPLRRAWGIALPALLAAAALAWRGLRPLLRWLFLALAFAEAALRAGGRVATRAATAASEAVTPRRAIGVVIAATGALLVVSQFLDYHAVRIAGAAYAEGVELAPPPAVAVKTAGAAHSYLLVPVGAIAVLLGLVMILRGGHAARNAALGAIVAGVVSLAVILLVDLPAGLDVGAQAERFAGATAVLEKGFSAELAAAGGMVLGGVLYYARPCLIRISLSGRAASARRRRPRRRASSRAKVARSA